ncbi:MAG: phosphohydrolase [Phycisphaerales bacterium]|nr:phosphohydrolase [Phycisphaerales bacterium]MDB5357298.1 phosphohydrolase [Phycisphaerales bacterium]
MLIVPMQEVRVGMVLATNVPHPEDPAQDLLKAGFVLDAPVLSRLADLGIDSLYIDYPDLRELDQILLPTLSPPRQLLYKQIKATIAAIQKTAKPTVGFADYYVAVRELVLTLMQVGEHPVYVELLASRLGDDAVAHAAAVAHLSLVLGIQMRRYLIDQRSRLPASHACEVINLGVAGMLHDLGKAKLPPPLRNCSSINPPADPAARAEWESHPQLAYDMIRGGVESTASVAVLQHHQRFDGNGFPIGQARDGSPLRYSGTKTHVFARLLCAADLFDRLAAGPEARRPNIEVLHLMRTQYAAWLDPEVFISLAQAIPPFPPGTKVELSDGTSAVISGLNPENPYRPPVRRFAPGTTTFEPGQILLAADGAPQIESVGGVCVPDLIPARAPRARACA